jgi:predicted amidohydrolase
MKVKIAAIQMISGPDVAPNLETARDLIARAAEQGAQLVALPEYFPMIGAKDADRLAAREVFGGVDNCPIQDFVRGCAQRHGIWLIAGSLPLMAEAPDKLRNSCLVYNPQGEVVTRYDKIHLFGFQKGGETYNESATIEAGSKAVAFDTPFGRIGLGVCYDLRFPELFRSLAPVDLLVVPSAFTETTGVAHWELLLRARAVENQCYVLAPAQGGRHPTGRLTFGNSMLIDPWGDVTARMDKGDGVVLGELDSARIAEVRTMLPALQHRVLK